MKKLNIVLDKCPHNVCKDGGKMIESIHSSMACMVGSRTCEACEYNVDIKDRQVHCSHPEENE